MANKNQNPPMKPGEHYCLIDKNRRNSNGECGERTPKILKDVNCCPINRKSKVGECNDRCDIENNRICNPPSRVSPFSCGAPCFPTEYDGPFRVVPSPQIPNCLTQDPPPEGCECCTAGPPIRPQKVIFDCCPVCPPPRPPPCVCASNAFRLEPRPPICIRGSSPMTPCRSPRCPGPCPYGLCPMKVDKCSDRVDNCCQPICSNSCYYGWKNCLADAKCDRDLYFSEKYGLRECPNSKPERRESGDSGKHHKGTSKPGKAAPKKSKGKKSGKKGKKAKSQSRKKSGGKKKGKDGKKGKKKSKKSRKKMKKL